MTTLVVTVFLASLLGSMHCAGMCGAFVVLCTADARDPRAGARAQTAYHAGRLVTYVLLGAVAGGLGAALDLTGSALFEVQRAALVVAGASIVAFGVIAALRAVGVRVPRVGVPGPMQALARRGHAWALGLHPSRRAMAIGLMSTLLPCGWLYAFAITAAGTGAPALGALVMAVFWAGTVPALAAVGAAAHAVAGPLRRHAPLLASLALVVVGMLAITGRFDVPALAAEPVAAGEAPGAEADFAALAEHVHALDADAMPCCADAETGSETSAEPQRDAERQP